MKNKLYKSKFRVKYGLCLIPLAKKLGVGAPALCLWERNGLNIFEKAKEVKALRGNKKLQQLWGNIHTRCYSLKDKKFKYYGGKGILVKIKKSELAYLWKRDKANKMIQPSIDRIDSDGHYELKNCRFIEMKENRKKS
jgi:hypothetical protein